MQNRRIISAGGLSFIVGALAFVAVFSYLAASFNYPDILDGSAAEVLPRLRGGGSLMRAVWALYAFLPLLLIPGAVGAYFACPASRGRMTLALVAASLGALAMCLGLMRWPSIHWVLADAYAQSDPDAQSALAAVFRGLNLYLGNYIGEFLGELCLTFFFLLNSLSFFSETRFPRWLGWCGTVFAVLFGIGAFRNAIPAAQPIADVNNLLLPLWMVTLGVSLMWFSRKA
ncbi:MAG: DUF4386 domain-containing protein [Acidobacteriota bacterium]